MKLPELLSPAGDMDSLRAAVENGADAVYMSGRNFNARRNAVNFGDEELKDAIAYAHVRGVNIYITMNTLVSDAEMPEAVEAAGIVYEAGADALIVQDIGFAAILKKHIPDLPLHISTQGTVYSAEGIRALLPLGFSRAILARELSLGEIARIAKESPIPVEVFAHGALCFSYSGQCLMSSMIGGRSGNRGLCAQPCRLPYSLDGAKRYLLSPKDLCTLELLPELVSTGVSALKIEGRMKSPEYVAVVTSVYRKYLDRLAAGGEYRVDAADLKDLLLTFDRGGFTNGYLQGVRGKALIARERPAPPDEARRAAQRALEARARATFTGVPRRKVGIQGRFTARVGEALFFEAWDENGTHARACSALPAEEALNLPLSAEVASEQLAKTGGTPFEIIRCAVEVDGRTAAKLSDLNALRRDVLTALEKKRAIKYPGRKAGKWEVSPPGPPAEPKKPALSLFLYRWRGDLSGLLHLADRVYVPFQAIAERRAMPERRPAELMAWLPAVTNGKIDELVRKHAIDLKELGLDGVLIGNPGQIELLKGCGLPLIGDATLNAFNGWTLDAFAMLGLKGVALSHELTMAQIAGVPDCGIGKEAVAYGRLPLMTSAYCLVGAEAAPAGGRPCGRCAKGGKYELRDRMGAKFPVLCDPLDCRCTVLNADTLYVPALAKRLGDVGGFYAEAVYIRRIAGGGGAPAGAFQACARGQCARRDARPRLHERALFQGGMSMKPKLFSPPGTCRRSQRRRLPDTCLTCASSSTARARCNTSRARF